MSMKNYSKESPDTLAAWDNVQTKLMCCGTEGSDDWRQTGLAVPNSCCKNENTSIGSSCLTGYHNEGCLSKLKSIIQDKSTVLIGVGIGIAFIQILGIVLACLLAHTIKREDGK
ncbi:hypothetical protein ILUMI_04889 [Ignelater luminosus]|uniref:Uncharacterized protein n=1 Tax=Ignelater luminosus TaxID=2038154 RepID=A0A8K0DDF5_IGNLU|nr:hypothetical protein ILUMI_04889 [Ignelater luminosus]